MDYKVQTDQFEGPLDLLLNLIEEQKLDITRVSLAKITDDYVAHVRSRENISLAHLTSFFSVAAKLILIKSKALLPLLVFDDDEEEDVQELERQLAALRVIKDIVPILQEAHQAAHRQYARGSMWGVTPAFSPDEHVTGDVLREAFEKSLYAIPQLDPIEEKIISDIVSLEQQITHVQQMIQERAEVAFSQITAEGAPTQEVVVSFLALLELVKQQIVVARQSDVFEDILLQKKEVI